ncbi:hypothetical protein L596_020983 [Steinernema carpocapsae]|uniref:DDE Tnp4 domain-containing protein n=1 Tax=Steinernema carpocapsae TaxID=34508 RepID=A0A4U5MVV1_STECR|nr:hypothetical protein L596_020983 [Steinernema carpocapsae]
MEMRELQKSGRSYVRLAHISSQQHLFHHYYASENERNLKVFLHMEKILTRCMISSEKISQRGFISDSRFIQNSLIEVSSCCIRTQVKLVAALDGKHFAIKAPSDRGSVYFNYKGFHSIVRLTWVDADYRFVLFNIGSHGRCSDAQVLASRGLRALLQNPIKAIIVCLGVVQLDPKSDLTALFKARRASKNCFGILVNRFRISPSSSELGKIKRSSINLGFAAELFENKGNRSLRKTRTAGDLNGEIAGNVQETSSSYRAASKPAKQIRFDFARYFLSPQGQLSWL